MKIDGRCHCGFIAYEVEADPEKVYICHCTDYRAMSGTAFRWAVSVPEGSFKLLTGKPKARTKTAESGATSLVISARLQLRSSWRAFLGRRAA